MSKATTLYGIPNCDTVKKARKWFDAEGISYTFHDYKKSGIDKSSLKGWIAEFGIDKVLNKRGTTWRQLDDAVKNNITTTAAVNLMVENTSLIKRPIVISGDVKLIGFDAATYKASLT